MSPIMKCSSRSECVDMKHEDVYITSTYEDLDEYLNNCMGICGLCVRGNPFGELHKYVERSCMDTGIPFYLDLCMVAPKN